MNPIRACNVQTMFERMKRLDKELCQLSPETASIFRERMQSVLAAAPRIGTANSKFGIFTTDTVADIYEQAEVVLRARGLDIDIGSATG